MGRWANRSWCRVQPIPSASGHSSTGAGCAAGSCTCTCCCPAAAQRASAGATSGTGCATSGAGTRAGAAWTWCSTAHVVRVVRQRREQRRLLGSGVSNCASWERPRLRARHQGVQGAHLIKWLNAAKWSREKSVLRLMIPEAPTCCWIWRLNDG